MKTRAEILAAIAASIEKMDALHASTLEAKDEAGIAAAKSAFDAEQKNHDALTARLAAFDKAEADRKARIDALRAAQAKQIDTVEIPVIDAKDSPAKPKDQMREEIEYENLFADFVAMKSLGSVARDALAPKSKQVKEALADSAAAVVPFGIRAQMMGKNYAQTFGRISGKTIYSILAGNNPSHGEKLVPTERIAELLMLPVGAPTIVDLVRIVPTRSGTVLWPKLVQSDADSFGGLDFQWIRESQDAPDTETTFTDLELKTNQIAGYITVSKAELRRSDPSIEPILSNLSEAKLRYKVQDAIINGGGSGLPLGILKDAGVTAVAAGTSNYKTLLALLEALPDEVMEEAVYAMNKDFEFTLLGEEDTTNRPMFRDFMVKEGKLIFNGYRRCKACPTVGVKGNLLIGAWKYYALLMEEEITMDRSEHAEFKAGRMAYRVSAWIGGRALEPRAFKVLDGTAS